ncbi:MULTISPECIES: glycoside hydrolase family 16 protein [unclassified Agarivorans]|uniref:glycoside hydrolase family 16 protein n=1 Tax=unclassified Agarivorans TaxID=2636026 RepID=UPI0026E1F16F|nr:MULTISPECIES: glycoside hydrolase family 16 protein [unclassified Agarivorans]MDO6684643.1 glycoside hydrolase family 16 protein [Agarivorans sp. 3_MG-2023]MDO6714808.1 glycoside hydrolase family 16 protein [Agarivorans sp. 2_MG-2023]
MFTQAHAINGLTVTKKTAMMAGLFFALTQSASAGWEVQWIDSFEGSRVDWSNWTAQTQANYNNEVQCYTDDDYSAARNYEVSDGTLKIIARKQTQNCATLGGQQKTWTSGRLNSKDKQEFLYGRVESRIRFHNLEAGTWPAFWMLENRISEQPLKGDGDNVNWPNVGAGEIDVWEWFSNEPNTYITNFFNVSSCGEEHRYSYPNGGSDVLNWHKYAMEWTQDKIDFYVDEILVVSQDISGCSQYQEPMFVLLNLAMGGNLGGFIDPNLQLATMEVDYIAHCQLSDSSDASYCDENAPRANDSEPNDSLASVELSLTQGGVDTRLVNPAGGLVTVTASIEQGEEPLDNYSLYWQADELPSPQMQGTTLQFEPASMLDGSYSLQVSLEHNSNNQLTTRDGLDFTVQATTKPSDPQSDGDSGGGSFGLISLFSLVSLLFIRRKHLK